MTGHTAYEPSAVMLRDTMKAIGRLNAAHTLLEKNYHWLSPEEPVRLLLEANARSVLDLIEQTSKTAQALHDAVTS